MTETNGRDSRAASGLRVAARTDRGLWRPSNQDSFFADPSPAGKEESHGRLFLVADGMGGHAAGEVASRLAVESFGRAYYEADVTARGDPAPVLAAALSAANRVIHEEGARDHRRSGMGTTCTAALIRGDRLWLAHVGDSRAYLFHAGALRQLTQDHNLAGMLLSEGRIDAREAAGHEGRHLLTRALGIRPEVEGDVAGPFELAPGDRVLLCSDGLNRVVPDDQLAGLLANEPLQAAVDELIGRSITAGGPDNITVVLVEVARG